jgi:hypothetical protein
MFLAWIALCQNPATSTAPDHSFRVKDKTAHPPDHALSNTHKGNLAASIYFTILTVIQPVSWHTSPNKLLSWYLGVW